MQGQGEGPLASFNAQEVESQWSFPLNPTSRSTPSHCSHKTNYSALSNSTALEEAPALAEHNHSDLYTPSCHYSCTEPYYIPQLAMSSSLLSTEPGGEQTQYEGAVTENQPPKKSGGQMGAAATTEDPSNTAAAAKQQAERGQQTAENIRYGQTISEGGMGGMTKGQQGKAEKEGFGRVKEGSGSAEEGGAEERVKAGYGGGKDMDRDVGA